MKQINRNIRFLFPGNKILIFYLACLGLILVSLLDMLGVAAILPVVQIAMGAEINGYLKYISQILNVDSRETLMAWMGIILVLSFVFKSLFSLAIKWYSSGFMAKQQTATSAALLKGYANEPYISRRQKSTAEILRTVNDATGQAYALYAASYMSLIGDLFSIILLTVLLLILMPQIALIAILYFSISAYLIQYFLKRKNTAQGKALMLASTEAMNAALESIVGYRENRLYGVIDRYTYIYQQKRMIAVNASRKQTFFVDLPKYLLEVIFILGIALILGILTVMGGTSGAPYLLVFAGACVRILPSFTRLVANLGSMRVGQEGVQLVKAKIEEYDLESDIKIVTHEPDIGIFKEINPVRVPIEIEVKDLSFKYPDSQSNVLNDINFKIPSGTSIAFVGGSGSGKTTLVDIILGMYTPEEGQVLVNGEPIQKNLKEWYSKIGYVPQDVFLGDSTVAQAVAFGLKDSELDRDRVYECLKIAELDTVIESMEFGIDTMIGEHGTRLSGGQKQRLGIARALYRNPSVLILDEATSALDNETEHKITQAIEKISSEIPVIIVAHRLSTIKSVDQLLFFEKGRISTRGTFEEVRRNNASFARLVELGHLSN